LFHALITALSIRARPTEYEASAREDESEETMKTCNLVRGVILALLMVGTAAMARADERVVVHIPFSFIAGTTQLPAGDYVVTEDVNDNQNVLAIESADGHHSVFALSIAAKAPRPEQTELIFEKFENRYFLSKVASEAGLTRQIPLSSKIMESEIVRVEATAPAAVTP
jgi:hypothetical protein